MTTGIRPARNDKRGSRVELAAGGFVPVPEFARVREPELVVCAAEGCENTFERRQDSKRKYCDSPACRYQVRKKQRHCKWCGAFFTSNATYADYCSVPCRNKAGHERAKKRERELANA
jgi:hypothetical protein